MVKNMNNRVWIITWQIYIIYIILNIKAPKYPHDRFSIFVSKYKVMFIKSCEQKVKQLLTYIQWRRMQIAVMKYSFQYLFQSILCRKASHSKSIHLWYDCLRWAQGPLHQKSRKKDCTDFQILLENKKWHSISMWLYCNLKYFKVTCFSVFQLN